MAAAAAAEASAPTKPEQAADTAASAAASPESESKDDGSTSRTAKEDFEAKLRRGAFGGKVLRLQKLFDKRRLLFAREGASARIAHAWRVHAFRRNCTYGLRRTLDKKTTEIQRVYRGHRGRVNARAIRAHMTKLATHAQRIWRAKAARRKLLELREARIKHWAAARMQAVFRGKRQRVVMRLWKSRQYMSASGVQTAWRIFATQKRRLDDEDEQLTTWMLDLLDLGFSRDPTVRRLDNRIAHRLALLARLRTPKKDGSLGDDDGSALAIEKKKVVSTAALLRKQQAAIAAVPVGVYDSRKAQRAKPTTTKVWTMASRSQKKRRTKTDLSGRAALLVKSGAADRGREGGSVYMGPSPKVAKPRILIPIPREMQARREEAEAEAERLGEEMAAAEAAGLDDDEEDDEDDDDDDNAAAAASTKRSRRRRRRFGATARSGDATGRSEYDNSGAAQPDLNPLEAPIGTKFDRRDKFGQPSIQEVLDDMRLVSDALQWHQERRTREERRRAAYAVRSAESKAMVEATKSRMTALRGEGVVETVRRLRSFVTGVTEIQAELRQRDRALRVHVTEHEKRLQRGRAALRKFDRSARDALRRAGGLLDAAELEGLLALLPSAQVMRTQTAVSRGQVGEWDIEAPGRRMTMRQRRLSGLVGPGLLSGITTGLNQSGGHAAAESHHDDHDSRSMLDESRSATLHADFFKMKVAGGQGASGLGAKAPGGFEGLFAGPSEGAESLPRTPFKGPVASTPGGGRGSFNDESLSRAHHTPSSSQQQQGRRHPRAAVGPARPPSSSQGSVTFATQHDDDRLAGESGQERLLHSSSAASRPDTGVSGSRRGGSRQHPSTAGSDIAHTAGSQRRLGSSASRRRPVAVFPTVTGAIVEPPGRPGSSSSSFAAAFLGSAGRAGAKSGVEALAAGVGSGVVRPPSALGASQGRFGWGSSGVMADGVDGFSGEFGGQTSARESSGGRSSTVGSLHRVAPGDAGEFPSRRSLFSGSADAHADGEARSTALHGRARTTSAAASLGDGAHVPLTRARSWRRGDLTVRRPPDELQQDHPGRPLTAAVDGQKSPGKSILVKSNRPRSPAASVKFALPTDRPSTAD